MMINNKEIIKIMEEFDIPISIGNMMAVEVIGGCRYFGSSIERWSELINYLKERATRDIYNNEEKVPAEYEGIKPDWIFYLLRYKDYIKIIKEMCRIINDKYLFPNDIVDIVYRYQQEKTLIFLKYMEKNSDSLGFEIEEKCYGELR